MINIFHRSREFVEKHKHHHHFFLAVLALVVAGTGVYTFRQEIVQAATYTFTQTSWADVSSPDTVSTASHTSNQTGWTKYYSQSGLTVGSNISLLSTGYSFQDDGSIITDSPDASGGSFALGATSSTMVSGSGAGASVGLYKFTATGGTITTSGGYTIHTFTATGTSAFQVTSGSSNVEYLVIGGGGGGGGGANFLAGGGGAGGMATGTLSATGTYTVTVGAGGAAGTSGNGASGVAGSNSVFSSITAYGGGYGGCGLSTSCVGGNGGSGGGGGYNKAAGVASPAGQGRAGGNNGGGGGGAGGVGAGGVNGVGNVGIGGVGAVSSIAGLVACPAGGTAPDCYYAGGGGGSSSGTASLGGSGGGGGYSTTTSTWIAPISNTGGGGAGGSSAGNTAYRNGASGVVIVRYSTPTYPTSGTFTSATIDFARPTEFTTMSWSATTPANTAVAIKTRSSANGSTWTAWDSCGTIASSAYFTTASPNCVTNGDQYIQYQATFSTTDTSVTPTLDSVTINDTQFSTGAGTLVSSKYDAGDDTNLISKLTWTGTGTSTTETIKFQVRSASSAVGLDSATWCGPTVCDGSEQFVYTNSGVTLASNHPLRSNGNDRWVQYKVFLTSAGAFTPFLTSVEAQYVVNAPPEAQNIVATPNSNGTVSVAYEVRDVDSAAVGSATPNIVAVTLQYCTTGGCTVGSDTGWVNATTVTGDVGSSVSVPTGTGAGTAWTAKTLTWTPATDYSGQYNSVQKIRIKVYDSEAANSLGYAVPASGFVLDTTVPALTTFNVAASSTPGTVNLTITDSSSPEYRLCDDSGYTTGCTSWTGITTATPTPVSKTLANNVNGRPEVYLQVRDAYGNTNSGSVTAPATPGTLLVADVANPTANYFGETLSWSVSAGAAGTNGYKIWYATTANEGDTAPSTYTYLTNSTSNVYTHTITTATTSAYWYRVTAVSTNSDISNFSAVMASGDIPDSFGTAAADTTAPDIRNLQVVSADTKSTSAHITFNTFADSSPSAVLDLATSTIQYSKQSDNNFASSTVSTLYVSTHSVYLTGLEPNTTYVYRVKVKDVLGNETVTPVVGTPFTTTGGPVITNVTEREITNNSALIFWNTSTSSTSYVKYATTQGGVSDSVNQAGNATMVPVSDTAGIYQHQVGLTGLTTAQTYYFQVTSTDSAGNPTTDTNNGQYYSFVTLNDTSPPIISATSTPVLAPDSAVVVWQTDEPATTRVDYGLTSGYGTVSDDTSSNLSIYHVRALTSLTKETTYYYRATSKDAANNTATADGTFYTPADGNVVISVSVRAGDTKDTTPPAISSVVVSDITPFGAVVKFSTDEDTDGFVKYGKDTTYGDAAGDEVWSKTHTIKLRGLTLGTDYHIKVSANDKAGNTGSSADQIFKTTFLSENLKDMANIENIEQFQKEIESAIESILPSLVPPFITKPIISDITESGAKISFKSNIKAFPVVVYAEDGAFDETKENPYTGEVSDTTEKATSHEIALTGLKGNTKYHVQARGFSLPKVIGKSADVTFITKASKIAGSIVERKKDSFTVVWTTDQPTTTIVEYKDLKRGITGRKTDDAKKTSHSMKIENLPSGTAYEVNLSGMTEQGNVAEAGSPLSVTTSTDTTPPTISGFKVDNALVPGRTDRIQTIVSWVTDEPSTSTAFYEEGAGTPGDTEELASKNEILDSYVLNHSVILPSLKPGTIYRLKVTSTDDSGNEGSFGPRTVITPKQTESITDIIFKNFEDSFKFLQKI